MTSVGVPGFTIVPQSGQPTEEDVMTDKGRE